MRSVALIVIAIAAALMAGCGLFPETKDETIGWSANKLYTEAKSALNDGAYTRAITYFEKLESRYPYGRYAQQAQIEIAYAYWKDQETASAIAACDRFIKLHPNHPNVDYVYYLRGLINFDRERSAFSRIAGLDMTRRDQGAPRQAFNDFAELIQRYPNGRYAADARQRMIYLRNQMARYEINVATYYLKRRAYVGAVNRAQYILENYPQSEFTGDAVAVMAESYRQLGQTTLEADARRVLELNHPNHAYFQGGWPREQAKWKQLIPFMGETRG